MPALPRVFYGGSLNLKIYEVTNWVNDDHVSHGSRVVSDKSCEHGSCSDNNADI